jgi:hypothetical protein
VAAQAQADERIRPLAALGLAFVLFGATACVTGRREFDLSMPAARSVVVATKGPARVGAVQDARRFENDPDEPSTPSINGDVDAESPEQLAKMIGRQRNTYGMAWGDIALPEGQTVDAKVRGLVEEALRRHSYAVVASGGADGADALDVRVDEFWAWFRPGFAYVTFRADVRVTVTGTLGGKPCTLSVEGSGLNKGQSGSDANWQLAYMRAFDDFLVNFEEALTANGF